MKCVKCDKNLKKADYKGIQLDYCEECQGIWFDRGELRKVKDKEDEFIRWIDIDPWKNKDKFEISKSGKICPVCGVPLYIIGYDGFPIWVDVCNVCYGIWLDKGEFDEIVAYMKEKVEQETLSEYLKDIGEEVVEVLAGPARLPARQEKIASEIKDLLVVMKLFEYRLLSRIPAISQIIARLPG